MDTKIPIPGIDRGGKGKTQGDSEGTMRVAGDNDTGRGNKGRSCAYIFVCTAEAFTLAGNENTQREECRVFGEGISRTGEEILGAAYLGERILCKYGGDKRRNNTGIYKKAAGRRRKRRTAKIVERQQRMTLSGVVVS